MADAYYSRESSRHSDGSRLFAVPADTANENQVAGLLSSAWRCTLRRFAMLAPIDWYAVRDERVVAVVEVKSRDHASTKHETVFLNFRKWLSLLLAQYGSGVPAIFVVKFLDCIKWIAVNDIDARAVALGGCSRLVKSVGDREPVILVRISEMHDLNGSGR